VKFEEATSSFTQSSLERGNIGDAQYHSFERVALSYEREFKNPVIVGGYDGSFWQERQIVNSEGFPF